MMKNKKCPQKQLVYIAHKIQGNRKETRQQPRKILIVCEGETELNYFEDLCQHFKLNNRTHKNVLIELAAKGNAPINILEHAKQYAQKEDFAKIFCVFDRDSHSTYQTTIQAVADMKKNGKTRNIEAIPSIPCFEYYVLLHFEYTSKPFSNPQECTRALTKYIPDYEKAKTKIFEKTKKHIKTARENAEKIAGAFARGDFTEPYTKIHELVNFLKDFV